MAITNWNNFIAAGVQQPWYATALEDALKGYKMQREPRKIADEEKKNQLANEMKKLELDAKPGQLDVEKRYKEALISKANALAKGGGTVGKPSGDFNNFMIAHPDATPEDKQKWFDEHDALNKDTKQSVADRRKQIMTAEAYNRMPAPVKAQQQALAAGLGLDPVEAAKNFEAGKTVSDLAKERGVDPKSIVPVYPMNTENIKQLQIRSSLVSELGQLDKDLTDIQGKYSRKFLGYSPKEIWGALKDDNPDEAGMILAARNVQPDLALVRAKIGINGAIGIEALKEMQSKALGNMKIFEPLVSPKARAAMDKYTNEIINRAFAAYSSKMQSYSQIQGAPGQQAPPNDMMSNALSNNQPSNQGSNFDFSQYPVAGGR